MQAFWGLNLALSKDVYSKRASKAIDSKHTGTAGRATTTHEIKADQEILSKIELSEKARLLKYK